MPYAPAGLRIGLLGGSFDPPHWGHVHISLRALRCFGLDQVWWLVSPGNPLKPDAPAAMERRLAACRAIIRHPRVLVTDLEARMGTVYTAQTLTRLRAHYPGGRFVWLMGADNLASVHRWESWQDIFYQMPVGVLARPGDQLAAGLSRAATVFARHRLPREASRCLPFHAAPAWVLLSGPMLEVSSTHLRRSGAWMR